MQQLRARRKREGQRSEPASKKRGRGRDQTPSAVTAARKRRFLEEFLECGGNTHLAAQAAGVSECTVDDWLCKDGEFRAHVEAREPEAHQRMCDALEAEADRRALWGVLKPVYQRGNLVGYVRKYSDRLLILRLKALMPAKYAGRPQHRNTVRHEHVTRLLELMRQAPDGPEQAPGRAELS